MFQTEISTEVRGTVESPDRFNLEDVCIPSTWSKEISGSVDASVATAAKEKTLKIKHKTSKKAVLVLFNILH